MSRKPTGASRLTPSVPRKSRSPSAMTVPPRNSISSAVATARKVTPAQATSASSSMSPEHAPPVAASRGMQARLDQRMAGLDFAGQPLLAEPAMRPQGHECGLGLGAIALLEWRLQLSQLSCVHDASSKSSITPLQPQGNAVVMSMPAFRSLSSPAQDGAARDQDGSMLGKSAADYR